MLGGNLLAHLRSLRTRLMLWNAGAVALTGILILLAMRAGVRYTLIGDLDQVLREDLKEIKLYFHEEQPYQWRQIIEDLNRKAAGHDFHRWFVQFYDLAGEPTWSSINTPPLPPLLDSQKNEGAFSIGNYRLSNTSMASCCAAATYRG